MLDMIFSCLRQEFGGFLEKTSIFGLQLSFRVYAMRLIKGYGEFH